MTACDREVKALFLTGAVVEVHHVVRIALATIRTWNILGLANEAELMADTTAGNAKLAGLEHTRSAVAHDVDILETELSK